MFNKSGKGGGKGPQQGQGQGKKRFKRGGAKGPAAAGPRKPGGPAKQQRKSPSSAQGGRTKSNQRSIDWNPMTDLSIRQPVSDQAAMTFEERKAAQLAKWRKELGLDD